MSLTFIVIAIAKPGKPGKTVHTCENREEAIAKANELSKATTPKIEHQVHEVRQLMLYTTLDGQDFTIDF